MKSSGATAAWAVDALTLPGVAFLPTAAFAANWPARNGLHMGLDVAFGPDEPAIYIQFGSAWLRL